MKVLLRPCSLPGALGGMLPSSVACESCLPASVCDQGTFVHLQSQQGQLRSSRCTSLIVSILPSPALKDPQNYTEHQGYLEILGHSYFMVAAMQPSFPLQTLIPFCHSPNIFTGFRTWHRDFIWWIFFAYGISAWQKKSVTFLHFWANSISRQ